MISSLLVKKNFFYKYFNTFLFLNVSLVVLETILFPSGGFRNTCSDLSCVYLIHNFEVMVLVSKFLGFNSIWPLILTILTLANGIVSSRSWNDIYNTSEYAKKLIS